MDIVTDSAVLSNHRILVDCRYLGPGGAGRVTEFVLRGLQESKPRGRWILWGPDAVREYLWPGAVHQWSQCPPSALVGQRALASVPSHDIALYMHQLRPLLPGRSVNFIHDTIPLRHGGSAISRMAKRLFFLTVSRLSSHILTDSQFSKMCIKRDLGVPSPKVTVVHFPVDDRLVTRVAELRKRLPRREAVLYVGRFASHKNVRGLIAAFDRTQYSRAGGELMLVGGSVQEIAAVREVTSRLSSRVMIEGNCPQSRLEELYATCRLLVMPSFEEGFGLPAWEAMTSGLPVVVSDGGSLPEIMPAQVRRFPAQSLHAMTAAVDAAVAQPYQQEAWPPPGLRNSTMVDIASQVVKTIERIAS